MLSTTWHTSEERYRILCAGLAAAQVPGLYCEFGVSGGSSLNYVAERVSAVVHGFDWFRGLPEDWRDGIRAGEWSTGGVLPEVRPNVELHVGLFHETLPEFLRVHPEPIAFAHVDCDLYSSTKTVLEHISPRIVPGTVLVFDEYQNFPGWERHEYRAFQELVHERSLQYEYIDRASEADFSVAVRII